MIASSSSSLSNFASVIEATYCAPVDSVPGATSVGTMAVALPNWASVNSSLANWATTNWSLANCSAATDSNSFLVTTSSANLTASSAVFLESSAICANLTASANSSGFTLGLAARRSAAFCASKASCAFLAASSSAFAFKSNASCACLAASSACLAASSAFLAASSSAFVFSSIISCAFLAASFATVVVSVNIPSLSLFSIVPSGLSVIVDPSSSVVIISKTFTISLSVFSIISI